jgi:hypothetical protein
MCRVLRSRAHVMGSEGMPVVACSEPEEQAVSAAGWGGAPQGHRPRVLPPRRSRLSPGGAPWDVAVVLSSIPSPAAASGLYSQQLFKF